MSDIDQAALIEGDFYSGAFGPSMLLVLTSRDAVSWLRAVFDGLAEAEVGTEFRLDSQPRVDRAPVRHLAHDGAGRFTWSCTAAEWRVASLLLEPLLTESGHQYLTSETDDDAIVEVSYGEQHRPTARPPRNEPISPVPRDGCGRALGNRRIQLETRAMNEVGVVHLDVFVAALGHCSSPAYPPG